MLVARFQFLGSPMGTETRDLLYQGRRMVDDSESCAMQPHLQIEQILTPTGLEPGITRSAGQRLTY